jgi:hypothetical protein
VRGTWYSWKTWLPDIMLKDVKDEPPQGQL